MSAPDSKPHDQACYPPAPTKLTKYSRTSIFWQLYRFLVLNYKMLKYEVLDEIRGIYGQVTVAFPWQKGDLLLVDNLLVAHGRNPFSGPRRILVAMA